MRNAFCWYFRASEAISLAMVAEKSSVRRVSGALPQNEFELVLEAEIEHLVGFIEHDDFTFIELEGAAVDVVLQPARRADDHVAAGGERALLTPSIHAANAGHDAPAGGLDKAR